MMDRTIRLYRTTDGPVAESDGAAFRIDDAGWDELFNDPDLFGRLAETMRPSTSIDLPGPEDLIAPVESQEVWAAGVTYYRSKAARMSEAEDAGGGDFYDRVYLAERPELFLKATPHRVAGPGQAVRIRRDTRWSVPEPELALAVNATGDIFGYTIGNDMSARDIEGENPLYLPQAKVYDQCCALGPGLLVSPEPMPPDTRIELTIMRGQSAAFTDDITLDEMKRSPDELVHFLYRDNSFPAGCFLLTGTGIVPPDAFTLQPGDVVRIKIEPIGILENHVIQHHE